MFQYIKRNRRNDEGILLKKANIVGNLCAGYGEIVVNQLYQNCSNEDIEGVYIFPLPTTAVISGFEAEIGGRTLKAVVEEKDKAFQIYENARIHGDSIFSLEEFSPHYFKIGIGKIISGETVKIRLSYVEELDYKDSTFKLTIPAVSEPKIIKSRSRIETLKDSFANRFGIKRLGDDFEFKVNIIVESLSKVDFRCPYHTIDVEREGDTVAKISLDENYHFIDKDFILFIDERETLEADGMIYEYKENDEEKGIVYIRMMPKLDPYEDEVKENYVFLIDISDTMKGEKLEQAKNALQLCLRNLSEGDTFDIIAMGVKLTSFSQNGLIEFNADSLREASKWIDDLDIEKDAVIFEGIKYSLEKEGSHNTILLFTDDLVDEEEEILEYVKDNIGDNRIFAFGIDSSANNYFLNKLAHESYGKAEFIDAHQRIEDIVLRQFNRIQNPQVDNIKIDWGKLQVKSSYPRTIDYMYDREPFSIFADVSGGVEGRITLIGEVDGKEYVRKIDIDNFNTEENASLLKKVWARKKIRSLKINMKFQRGEKREEMRRELIELSKQNGFISPETTFIFMELREEPVLGIQLKNIIPIKVNETTLGEKIDEDVESGFWYRSFNTEENEKEYSSDNRYLDKKYAREKLLRVIAKNQFADGAFVDYEDSSIEDKIETTSMVMLAFITGDEKIDIYANQLNKAAAFICKSYFEVNFEVRYDIIKMSILALNKMKRKKLLKDKYITQIDKTIEKLCEVLHFNEETKPMLRNLMNNSFKRNLASLFMLSEDGRCIEEKITIVEERNSIFDMAKLAVLKTFNK
ncbi:VIT and VWA domain-containing protein [Clostridium sp. WLY-B-L2]|uniref:VIT and VWA domain-containing protein n=2 Tax=Clostridia TaxID=186801 RepID=A0ABS8N6G5_9CLOT|nr:MULTISPECIES: VIT and VWA domain-containing protein [Clostridium]KAA8676033.1 VWA domain-containing protein [Clostridium sp. HV4-5-A1G]MCC9295416.1 VIT and VWA domain-containing protein [Clostridium aromativorans]